MQVPASFFHTSPGACGYAVSGVATTSEAAMKMRCAESGIGSAGGRRARRRRTCVRAGQFPLAHHPPGGQLPARRRCRCGGAAVRRQARPHARPAGGGREPRRRLRHHRRQPGRGRRSRRLHRAGRVQLDAGGAGDEPAHRTRHRARSAGDRQHGAAGGHRGHPPGYSRRLARRADRARAHAPTQLRLARRGLGAAPRDRASVHRHLQCAHGAHPVPGRGPGTDRGAGRARSRRRW